MSVNNAGMDGAKAVTFVVHNKRNNVTGFAWRIGAGRTSFYIKPQHISMSAMKVSLHGPDERHPKGPFFRFGVDRSAADQATAAGGRWWGTPPEPLYFSGRPIKPGVRLAVRFSVGWSMFATGTPSAPTPVISKSSTLSARMDSPRLLRAVHTDLYISERNEPYWPDEAATRRANAGMGPIINDAGQILTAVNTQVQIDKEPDPFHVRQGNFSDEPIRSEARARALAVDVDTTGLLWICEKLVPHSEDAILSTSQG